jgi:hypothetical protein
VGHFEINGRVPQVCRVLSNSPSFVMSSYIAVFFIDDSIFYFAVFASNMGTGVLSTHLKTAHCCQLI